MVAIILSLSLSLNHRDLPEQHKASLWAQVTPECALTLAAILSWLVLFPNFLAPSSRSTAAPVISALTSHGVLPEQDGTSPAAQELGRSSATRLELVIAAQQAMAEFAAMPNMPEPENALLDMWSIEEEPANQLPGHVADAQVRFNLDASVHEFETSSNGSDQVHTESALAREIQRRQSLE
eukprot:CAMPEP_0197705472 /NCGR_PEP_ID=MMETSP1338-20131121/126460_1 /TAXON_ID=43686 ORGANISM="Pelagodinium beii, Strain RCC1491" /NCGR_SAMPLE_ID=MMETSP1338 /ASSEMBLY_ACC=CAM_ASM_000754 /LENGTH=180 /DNA_ID=CAMNT_0043289381 /DNA_START=556 /DNA_END=1098 /DNA_ORIENTATION=-